MESEWERRRNDQYNYYVPFFPESLRRTLDRPDGITKKFALFCSSMTHCVALASEDMPNKLLIYEISYVSHCSGFPSIRILRACHDPLTRDLMGGEAQRATPFGFS